MSCSIVQGTITPFVVLSVFSQCTHQKIILNYNIDIYVLYYSKPNNWKNNKYTR